MRKHCALVGIIIVAGLAGILFNMTRPDLRGASGLAKTTGFVTPSGFAVTRFIYDYALLDPDVLWVVEGTDSIIPVLKEIGYQECTSRSPGEDRAFMAGIVFQKTPDLSARIGDYSVWRGGPRWHHYILVSADGRISAHWYFCE